MLDPRFELAGIACLTAGVVNQSLVVVGHRRAGQRLGVLEDARGAVHEVEADFYRRPQRGRFRKPAVDDSLELLQLLGQPPFSSTFARLAETAVSRSCSFRPLDSSGGRPSSVMTRLF